MRSPGKTVKRSPSKTEALISSQNGFVSPRFPFRSWGFANSEATWILLRPPRDKILSVYLGLVNSVRTRAIAKAFMMKTKEKKERKGEQNMISQKLASMLLPTKEEDEKAILAFLYRQPNKSASEEELSCLLGVFHTEVVKARFTLAMLQNLTLDKVNLTLDGDRLRWHAAEEGKSRETH
jgi:hypothetical protein